MASGMRALKWDMGKVDPLDFSADCEPGDWNGVRVNFSSPFLNPSRLRILITANRDAVSPDRHAPAVVPVASNVTQFSKFITANDASQHAPNTGLFQAYPYSVQDILAAGIPTSS